MNIFKRFKTWIITFLIGGVVLAAGNAMLPNNSFENLPNVAREVGIYKLTVDKYTEIEIPEKTKPEATLRKWGDETYIKVWYDDIEYSNSKQDKGKLKWQDNKKEVHLYEIEEGFEFEVILKEKPVSNVIELGIESKGLDFFYQPALHPDHPTYDERTWNEERQDWDYNSFRPENVVGSYAVYHSGNPINYVGGTEYKTGKAFHIYRPQMEDANGWKVWGELLIDAEKGIHIITIPQDFIDNAVYPIRHASGEVFGYEGEGLSETNIEDQIVGSVFTGVAGIGTNFTAYGTFLSSVDRKAALYTNSDSKILKNGTSSVATLGTMGTSSWQTFDFVNVPTFSATDYVIVAWNENFSFDAAVLNYDTGATDQGHTDVETFNGFPATATFVHNDNKYSIYVTYTPSGASAPYNPRLRRVIIVD